MKILLILFLFVLSSLSLLGRANELHFAFSTAGYKSYEYVNALGYPVYTLYVKPDFSDVKIKEWPDRLINGLRVCPVASKYMCVMIPPGFLFAVPRCFERGQTHWRYLYRSYEVLGKEREIKLFGQTYRVVLIKSTDLHSSPSGDRQLTWSFLYSSKYGLLEFNAHDADGKLWQGTVFSKTRTGFGAAACEKG